MTVGWIYHPRFLEHQTGKSHPESPERLGVIVEALKRSGLLHQLKAIPFETASTAQLALAHDPAYVDIVRLLGADGFTFIGDSSTSLCEASFEVAALASGGVLAACQAVMSGTVRRVFCAVRPPGHHASADQAMGFCLFNHVAIAAEHLVRDHGLQRVAIVDLDAHHGNGTQNIFAERLEVLYISLHERPESASFPASGYAYEEGIGVGRGGTLNVPLDRSSDLAAYRRAMKDLVLPRLDHFAPEFLLLSIGFDALVWDRIANLSLEPEDYGVLTRMLVDAADRYADGRLVSVLEGGYDLGHLGAAGVEHVRGLMSLPSSHSATFGQE